MSQARMGGGEGYHVKPNANHYNCLTSHSLHCSPSFFSTCFGSCKLLSQKVLGALLLAVELFLPLDGFN
jgi:hypothetical protein